MAKSLIDALEEARLTLEAVLRGEYCCLRHGLPYVTPSLLSEQAFCEQRLEERLTRGLEGEPPASPLQARRLLEAILGARRRLWTGKERIISVPLAAVLHGVPIAGRAAAMALHDGCVAAIYNVKVTKRHRLYLTDRVKAYAYALLTEASGIACSNAKLVVVTTREPLDLQELRALIPNPEDPRPMKGDNVAIHILAHDPGQEEMLLAPLLAYWRNERSPRPRPGPWCNTCPFRETCMATQP